MASRTGPHVLIVRLSAIGDVVVTTPVARALREAFPDAHIAWLVEPMARGILKGNPFVDEIVTWDRPKGAFFAHDGWTTLRDLRSRRFDWAIDCQGNLRSALVARLSGARRVVGNTKAKEHADLLYHHCIDRSTTDLSNRQRCLDLLQPLGIRTHDRRMCVAISDAERAEAQALLRENGVQPGHRYACLVPATTWPQKHWQEPEWGTTAALLAEELELVPAFLGGKSDGPLIERIRRHSGGAGLDLSGRTPNLKVAAALVEDAALTVTVDTALMHASVAVGTPTVALCGASWWPGFQDYEGMILVREPLPCSPCLHHPTCGGRFDCMRAITPKRVLAAASTLLGATLVALT
jgi:heptosyltransferase-1